MYHSTLDMIVIKRKEEKEVDPSPSASNFMNTNGQGLPLIIQLIILFDMATTDAGGMCSVTWVEPLEPFSPEAGPSRTRSSQGVGAHSPRCCVDEGTGVPRS